MSFITGPVYAGADKQLVGIATLYVNTPVAGSLTVTLVRTSNNGFNSPFWSTDDALWQLYTDTGSLGSAIDVGAPWGAERARRVSGTFELGWHMVRVSAHDTYYLKASRLRNFLCLCLVLTGFCLSTQANMP